MMRRICPQNNRGFTLIELLSVIAVIAVLAGILIPTINRVRAKGHQTESASNLRQMGAAANMWSNENSGKMIWNQDDSGLPFTVLMAPYLGYDGSPNSIRSYFQSKAIDEEKPEGVFDNPAVDYHMNSGHFADYGINIYASGWQSSSAAHLKGGWRASNIPEPARVIWMAESKNCNKNIRGNWGNLAAPHAGDTLNILYVDGRVELRPFDEVVAITDRSDYPWGWPGHP